MLWPGKIRYPDPIQLQRVPPGLAQRDEQGFQPGDKRGDQRAPCALWHDGIIPITLPQPVERNLHQPARINVVAGHMFGRQAETQSPPRGLPMQHGTAQRFLQRSG